MEISLKIWWDKIMQTNEPLNGKLKLQPFIDSNKTIGALSVYLTIIPLECIEFEMIYSQQGT